MHYIKRYLAEVVAIVKALDPAGVQHMIDIIAMTRKNSGRLFILGVGGSAANASHAVNDFRKIVGIEAYTPTDNVAELTARINDDGWDTSFMFWLQGSRLNSRDVVLVFSVGGGDADRKISNNLVVALKYAKEVGSKIIGIVGKDGGYTAKVADVAVIIPNISAERITPHTEAFQSIIWHLIVAHPELKAHEMKWESMQ